MPERQPGGHQSVPDLVHDALRGDRVAEVAVIADALAFRVPQIGTVTPETPRIDEMSSILRITVPADPHLRKHVLPVDILNGGDCFRGK